MAHKPLDKSYAGLKGRLLKPQRLDATKARVELAASDGPVTKAISFGGSTRGATAASVVIKHTQQGGFERQGQDEANITTQSALRKAEEQNTTNQYCTLQG